MNSPDSAGVPDRSGKARWAARLRSFGKIALSIVLIGICVLWVHELFQEATVRQRWKLKVLMVFIPLAVTASLSLGIAWLMHRPNREKR
jgi:hypothetical protein